MKKAMTAVLSLMLFSAFTFLPGCVVKEHDDHWHHDHDHDWDHHDVDHHDLDHDHDHDHH